MAIPYWRHVRDECDGHSVFQCLNCYREWDAGTNPSDWTYCPYCSCKWQGQHQCRTQDFEAWAWRYGFESLYDHAYTQALRRNSKRLEESRCVWLIEYHYESPSYFADLPPKIEMVIGTGLGQWKRVVGHLQRFRNEIQEAQLDYEEETRGVDQSVVRSAPKLMVYKARMVTREFLSTIPLFEWGSYDRASVSY